MDLVSRSRVLVVLVAVAVASAVAADDACAKLRSGSPCTIDGESSRCLLGACRPRPKRCDATLSELESCDSRIGVCSPWLPGSAQLYCLNMTEVGSYKNYDACNDKTDGAACRPHSVAGDSSRTVAVFEERTGKCKDHYCLREAFASCLGKSKGDKCSFTSSYNGFWFASIGTCAMGDTSVPPTMFCEMSSTEPGLQVAPAAPVQVFDNRPNATDRTNVQTADLCNLDYTGCPCTLRNNATSRCTNGRCPDSLPACPAKAQPLDSCGTGFCFSFLSSQQLTCLEPVVVREALKYDACVGKREWDACTSIDYSYMNNGSSVKLYELPNGRCVRRQCLAPDQLPCAVASKGEDCQVDTLYQDKMVRVKGTCQADHYAATCSTDDDISVAKVVSTGVKPIPNTRLAIIADLKPEPRQPAPPLSERSGPTPGVGGGMDGRIQSAAAGAAPVSVVVLVVTVVALGVELIQ